MARHVIPEFSTVLPSAAAEAFSEPFVRPSDFLVQFPKDAEHEGLSIDNLAAIGSGYIDDEGQAAFAYAIHPSSRAPYTATQAFVDGYDGRFSHEHKQADETVRVLGPDGLKFWEDSVVEYVERAGLRTIGSYALFSTERSRDYMATVIISSTVAKELPLEGREDLLEHDKAASGSAELIVSTVGLLADAKPGQADKVTKDIMLNRGQDNFAIFTATLHMPRIKALRKIVDQHPAIQGFVSMPRKQKRELLRAEQKAARKSN